MRTDKSVDRLSFRQSKQWRTDQFANQRVPEIDRRLDGVEYVDGQIHVHSLSGHERNHLFYNCAGKTFSDISLVSGIDNPADSRGFVWFDFDRDGMLDIAMVNANTPLLNLYRNNMASSRLAKNKNFIGLRFVGGNATSSSSKLTCRDGFGAIAELTVDGIILKREHRCGDGYGAQNSQTMHIGIGASVSASSCKIRWPSGEISTTTNVPAGSLVTVYEVADQSPTKQNFVIEPYSKSTTELAPVAGSSTGKRFDLGEIPSIPTSDSKYRVYVTMATWCEVCKRSLPLLQQMSDSLPSEFELVGLPIDKEDDVVKLRAYVAENSPPYQLAESLTSQQRSLIENALATVTPPAALPTTILVDDQGMVLFKTAGIASLSDLRAAVADR